MQKKNKSKKRCKIVWSIIKIAAIVDLVSMATVLTKFIWQIKDDTIVK